MLEGPAEPVQLPDNKRIAGLQGIKIASTCGGPSITT
jgi:hypothetical protein